MIPPFLRRLAAGALGDPVGRAVGLLALVLAIPFGWWYFFKVETTGHFERDAPPFYRAIRHQGLGWLRLRDAELEAALRGGNPDYFHTLVARTTLQRWRLRALEPRLFERHMEGYERGAWLIPPRDRWVAHLRAADATWLDARRSAIARNSGADFIDDINVVDGQPGIVRIQFPAGVTTADLGSRVRIVFRVPAGAPTPRPRVYWNVAGSQSRVGYRRMTPRMATQTTADGAIDQILELDFFAEPAWTTPTTAPAFIELLGAPPARALYGLTFDDSRWLDPATYR